jgi:hypothetical protein
MKSTAVETPRAAVAFTQNFVLCNQVRQLNDPAFLELLVFKNRLFLSGRRQ